ncbi:hypothetical protein J6590_090946 [Homalodisca vitripennis]|nr:hypothetical protein J6590_090946 [Homalodisca vitripennis]
MSFLNVTLYVGAQIVRDCASAEFTQLRKTFLSITQSGATHTVAAAAVTQRAKTATCDVCGKVVVKRCMLRHQRTNTCRSVGGVDLRTACVESNVTADCEESTACQHSRCEEANATTISLVSPLNTCTPGHYVQVSDLIPHQYYKVVKLEKVDSTILATFVI